LPAVLHWDMNHFVVLTKVAGRKITVHDPARGKRVLTLDEASRHFTGVAMEFTPTTAFQKKDEREKIRSWQLLSVASGLKGTIAQIGTPRDIYFTPRNRFVAEFIGAANIIEASVENGCLLLPGGRQPIASKINLALAVAMVRPESIHLIDAGNAALAGTVDSVTFNGDRQRLVVSGVTDRPLSIEVSNTVQAQPGERVGLSIAPEAIRLLPLED